MLKEMPSPDLSNN